jgi:hypothetical protein
LGDEALTIGPAQCGGKIDGEHQQLSVPVCISQRQ